MGIFPVNVRGVSKHQAIMVHTKTTNALRKMDTNLKGLNRPFKGRYLKPMIETSADNPITASGQWIWWMHENMSSYVESKPGKLEFCVTFTPKRFFNCLEAIVREAAVVKAEVTGADMKLIRNPMVECSSMINGKNTAVLIYQGEKGHLKKQRYPWSRTEMARILGLRR